MVTMILNKIFSLIIVRSIRHIIQTKQFLPSFFSAKVLPCGWRVSSLRNETRKDKLMHRQQVLN